MLVFKGSAYAEALATLHTLCFDEPWSLANFQQILNLPTTFGFGNDKGFILCADLGNAVEILTLAVHPDHRRHGLATKLLTHLQQYTTQHHKDKIFLEVNVTNQAALHLYLKNGFVQTGCRKNYYHVKGRHFDALCLTWEKPQN